MLRAPGRNICISDVENVSLQLGSLLLYYNQIEHSIRPGRFQRRYVATFDLQLTLLIR